MLERICQNQLGLEAALLELTLHVEQQGITEVRYNVRGALWAIGENAGNINRAWQSSGAETSERPHSDRIGVFRSLRPKPMCLWGLAYISTTCTNHDWHGLACGSHHFCHILAFRTSLILGVARYLS